MLVKFDECDGSKNKFEGMFDLFPCQAAPSKPLPKNKAKAKTGPKPKAVPEKTKVLPPPKAKTKATPKPKPGLKRPAAVVEPDTESQSGMERPAAANLKSEPASVKSETATEPKKRPAAPSGQTGQALKSKFHIMIFINKFWNHHPSFPEVNPKSQAYITTKRRVSVR